MCMVAYRMSKKNWMCLYKRRRKRSVQEAAAAAARGAPRAEGFELDLLDAVGVWLTPSALLLALASGQLVLLNLEISAGSVSRIRIQKANDAPRPSCGCRLGQSWVFLGSWVGDSLLLHAAPDGHKVNSRHPITH